MRDSAPTPASYNWQTDTDTANAPNMGANTTVALGLGCKCETIPRHHERALRKAIVKRHRKLRWQQGPVICPGFLPERRMTAMSMSLCW